MGRLTNKIIENLPVQSKGYILWDGETNVRWGFNYRRGIQEMVNEVGLLSKNLKIMDKDIS